MKASELIETLQKLIEKYGDGEVIMEPDDSPYFLEHAWFNGRDEEYILE